MPKKNQFIKAEKMSALNALKGRFNTAVVMLQPYKMQVQMGFLLLLTALAVYAIMVFLTPHTDEFEQVILADNLRANELGLQYEILPPMTSGGEYTFQTWMFISNYDYRAGQPKHVFTISSDATTGSAGSSSTTVVDPAAAACAAAKASAASSCGGSTTTNYTAGSSSRPGHVTMLGVLYPTENKMMIRVYQGPSVEGFANDSDDFQTADLTVTSNYKNLFQGKMSSKGLRPTLDYPLCDIQNIPLQKWVCLAVVMNGRVMDVYMDGKLARSCVLPGVPIVESGRNYLSLGLQGGWAGNVSTTRFYGYALTPQRLYELYQEGPDGGKGPSSKYGFLGYLAERVGLRVDYF
jgi:hypothetical protein